MVTRIIARTKNKKGQMKIQQMVMMILAVTLFFVLAGMLILTSSFSNLKQKAAVIQQDNAKLLVTKIADSPEFSCGDSFGTGMSSCIDADKAINIESRMNEYGNGSFWGINGLVIRKIFPENKGVDCTKDNFPNCDIITVIPPGNGTGVSNFASMCEFYSSGGETYPRCYLAQIIITYKGSV